MALVITISVAKNVYGSNVAKRLKGFLRVMIQPQTFAHLVVKIFFEAINDF